jgi:hypothetical protein
VGKRVLWGGGGLGGAMEETADDNRHTRLSHLARFSKWHKTYFLSKMILISVANVHCNVCYMVQCTASLS